MHDQQNNFVVKKKQQKNYDYQETPFIEVNITTFTNIYSAVIINRNKNEVKAET